MVLPPSILLAIVIWIQLADAYLAHAKKSLIDDTRHARDLGLIYVK